MPQLSIELIFDQVFTLLLTIFIVILVIQYDILPAIIRVLLLIENNISRKSRFFIFF